MLRWEMNMKFRNVLFTCSICIIWFYIKRYILRELFESSISNLSKKQSVREKKWLITWFLIGTIKTHQAVELKNSRKNQTLKKNSRENQMSKGYFNR